MEKALGYFLMSWVDPYLFFLVALGTLAGIYVGAIPGLSVTMAVSILISFTYAWDTNEALALMVGIYMGGVYGGSRTAILLNIPGAPAAIATALDGYPLAKLGEAGRAIGVTTVVSFLGGFVGILALAFGAPLVAEISLMFAPRDYMLLGIMGLLLVASLSGESLLKGVIAGALGILVSMVGLDTMSAQPRLTFGSSALLGGVSYVAVMIGMFGIAEALVQLHTIGAPVVKQRVDRVVPALSTVLRHLPLTLRASAIGVWIGALPGTGGDIAALMAYDHAKKSVKNPSRPFGQGAYEGLVAPEAANNAAVGGAFIPMLTLGIPGDAVTAVIIAALFIHGLRPGPNLMVDTPHLFWFTVGNLTLANFFLLVFGLTGIRLFAKIVEVPKAILLPIVVVLSVVGAYAINNSLTDVYWAVGFGIFGYVLRVYGYQLGPVVLGVILGPIVESNFRRTMIAVRESWTGFLLELVSHPITFVLLIGILLSVLRGTPLWPRLSARLPRPF
ncbi:MAG: tripartite tricarboxylate transporter permease [Geminicoccaceae bacterium]|nr:tripartite tricarboxylate transporter permease [Geminicoccaceae bacterium]MCS7268922.1 tripartite tricarboxylate transporter permease [Geminicoccaceae bacterium]MDW8125417.1 tripartite tricarboxylate transporter permease [Geminicoccaceae bacterium]MDW8341052.1 tripartite tricarboxylate transporter permease [Geminicoccaceae bacterium]